MTIISVYISAKMKHHIKTKLLSLKSITIRIWTKFRSFRTSFQIIIGAAVLAAIILYKFLGNHHGMPPVKVVETHKVTKGSITQTSRLLGTILAERLFTPTAGCEGTLSDIAPAGSHLQAGDIIAKVQNGTIEDAYHSALKTVQIAGDQYNRQLTLFHSKATSKKSVEDHFTALNNAKSALVDAKINYDKIVFVAPFDGLVGSAVMHVGSRVKPGEEIVSFYDNRLFFVDFDIPSDYAKKLDKDAIVTIDKHDYKIDFIQKVLSAGTYTVPAYVKFPCSDCISGELVDVDLHLISKQNVIIVPKSCIVIRGQGHFVYKVKDGKVELAPVTLGVSAQDQVEVIEGLIENDEIVMKGLSRLYPGSEVKVFEGE